MFHALFWGQNIVLDDFFPPLMKRVKPGYGARLAATTGGERGTRRSSSGIRTGDRGTRAGESPRRLGVYTALYDPCTLVFFLVLKER